MADEKIWKRREDPARRPANGQTIEAQPGGETVPAGSLDIETITIANLKGPLVILYGPADVGKTVTLLRLSKFVAPGYAVVVDPNFRSDSGYKTTVDEFEAQRRKEVFAPASTQAIKFLLVDVSLRGAPYCQILEAPGEHFFPKALDVEVSHPFYLQTIFQSSIRKIYAIFFELSLMNNNQRFEAYVSSIMDVLSQHADARKDRILIIFNKCDQKPELNHNGRPSEKAFRSHLFSNPAFAPLAEFLKANRFERIHFVPFSSGRFGKDRDGRQTFAMSADHYPQALWRAIDDCVSGRTPWPWSIFKK